MRRSRLAAVLAVCLASLAPLAARAGTPFHGAVRVGALVPTELERFDTGFAVELAGGWWATPSLSLEVAAGRKTVQGPGGFLDPQGDPVTTRLTLYPLTLTARWSLWLGDWRPYLLAGAGAEITRIRPAITDAAGGPLATPRTKAALLLQGGAGVVYQVDEHFAFGLEGRYARARLDGGDLATDGVTAAATMEYRY